MSSLRVETLRLCWLDAFVAVAEQENISEAARELGVDQSTGSRYLQRLEAWLGKRLIEPGAVYDDEDARVSIGLTDDGREFFKIALEMTNALSDFRSPEAKRAELVKETNELIRRMAEELAKGRNPSLSQVRQNVEAMRDAALVLDQGCTMEFVEAFHREVRGFFTAFEKRKRSYRPRKKTPAPQLDKAFFERLEESAHKADR